ncbi:Matrix metalloproteinase-15 [Homalodisca vitripennis]|nr:Matrix metalloproteinase-15 [Homalodisca vitripennis]
MAVDVSKICDNLPVTSTLFTMVGTMAPSSAPIYKFFPTADELKYLVLAIAKNIHRFNLDRGHGRNKYWVYNGNDIVEGSPRPISDYGLPNTVKKVDAVMVWAKNRKTYLFSGDRFWRYNETSRMVDSGYPRRIELFRGVPPNLDSAMTWSDGGRREYSLMFRLDKPFNIKGPLPTPIVVLCSELDITIHPFHSNISKFLVSNEPLQHIH